MNRLTTLILGLCVTFGVSACNTIEGMGKDIKAAGSSIEKAAEKK